MDKEKFIELVIQEYDDSLIIKTTRSVYTIENSENCFGGEKGFFMSDLLGTTNYNSLQSIASDMYDYITDRLNEEITDVYWG